MKGEAVSVLASVIIAFSTFIGVGAASAYYMIEIKAFRITDIIMTEVIYMLMAFILLIGIKLRLAWKLIRQLLNGLKAGVGYWYL